MTGAPFQLVKAERDLTADEARTLTRAIRNDVAELELKLVRAYQGRAWLALGYATWDEYIAGEFKAAPLALPREQRPAAVQSLRGWGLSTRAIAPAVGVDRDTVAEDLRQLAENPPPNADPLPPVTGLDGKTYAPPKPKAGPTPPNEQPDPVTVTPSGIPVPPGDNPHEYESDCHTDPSGGANQLRDILRSTDRLLANYYVEPSATHLDLIEKWLTKHQRKLTKARKNP